MSDETSSNRSSPIDADARRPVSAEVRAMFECPDSAESLRIITQLNDAGFTAYLAGGCVRDAMLGRPPKDYDVATDATPKSVRKVFGHRNTLAFGASFGVIGVLPEKPEKARSRDSIVPTEVATFRSDGEYSDGRRPDSVHYGNAKQDALRRDFTINGMFYDPVQGCLIDFVDGATDLSAGIIRTIGDAHQRFDEDKLRMLRAVRFATTLHFSLTDETRDAIIRHADTISVVSGERVGAEMRRILQEPNAISGLRLLTACELVGFVFPEWNRAESDRASVLLENLRWRTFSTSLASVLLTIPESSLQPITSRWKLSGEEKRQILAAIDHHQTILDASNLPWSRVQPVMIDRDIETIVAVAESVAKSKPEHSGGPDLSGIELAKTALTWPPERLNPKPILSGKDLSELGYQPGPGFAKALRMIRNAQLDGNAITKDDAVRIAASELDAI